MVILLDRATSTRLKNSYKYLHIIMDGDSHNPFFS